MDPVYEADVQRVRREELLREAESARLARRLRREKESSGASGSSLDRLMAPVRVVFRSKPVRSQPDVGECEG